MQRVSILDLIKTTGLVGKTTLTNNYSYFHILYLGVRVGPAEGQELLGHQPVEVAILYLETFLIQNVIL